MRLKCELVIKYANELYFIWRTKGFGPKYYKLGRSVRYKKADVDAWIDENISQSTAKAKK